MSTPRRNEVLTIQYTGNAATSTTTTASASTARRPARLRGLI
jgi:hypothetical protein